MTFNNERELHDKNGENKQSSSQQFISWIYRHLFCAGKVSWIFRTRAKRAKSGPSWGSCSSELGSRIVRRLSERGAAADLVQQQVKNF